MWIQSFFKRRKEYFNLETSVLFIEQLSDRVMLSGSVIEATGLLEVRGTDGDDQIFVSSEGGQLSLIHI